MSTYRTLAPLALACLAIGGCAIQRAQDAADAKAAMVGMPKEAVLQCMGAPVNSAAAGSTEVWSYTSGNGQVDFDGSRSTTRSCKTDVIMQADRVTRVNYSGPTGGVFTAGEQCAFAVENCIHQAPAAAR